MKNKILLFALIMLLLNNKSFGQLMTFGFVKNCMTYGRSTVTDELKKKQFFMVERQMQASANKLFDGAAYYSNEKDDDKTKGEIKVLSQINGSKQITEISFVNGSKNDFSKNYTEVYNQIVSFFDNENAFKSSKYKTDVLNFRRIETIIISIKLMEYQPLLFQIIKLRKIIFQINLYDYNP